MSTEKMRASFRLLMLIATPKLTDKALLLFEKGKLPMQLPGVCAWHGLARDDGYAGTGQRRKEPAADDDAQDGRGRPADSFAPGTAAGSVGQRHRVHRADLRREQTRFADGAAGLSGKAEVGNEEGAYAG